MMRVKISWQTVSRGELAKRSMRTDLEDARLDKDGREESPGIE